MKFNDSINFNTNLVGCTKQQEGTSTKETRQKGAEKESIHCRSSKLKYHDHQGYCHDEPLW